MTDISIADFIEHRQLQEDESATEGETWEMIYVGFVLCFMFAALLSDKIGVSAHRFPSFI